ncbi:hypothetical protein GCM10022225_79260 [Plantactinospora mayteni]|uniref:Uncharacterized protein n=1 Tax=Plantactinospora mayteni TaxID=566021 RepID=A0ABQ4F2U7_9ACTN|nr:hypothetical protein [Plantactinospora mayteni]GIH01224.1 hypothetical protein Pma05_77960 [Plantactinospora mayteni]
MQPQHSEITYAARLRAHGATVPLIDVGVVEHGESAIRSVPQVLDWFEQLR